MWERISQGTKKAGGFFGIGFFMGSADLVPGVSGGTIALLCGIYERLLASVKLVTGEVVVTLMKGKVREALSLVPFAFLLPLGLGILSALFTLAHTLTWLLEAHPVFVWSFFFGLILASTYVVLNRTTLRTGSTFAGFAAGILGGYLIVGLVPVETPLTWWMVFISGAIAICAMVLPGISGSFMLVLLGQYQHILSSVAQFRWGTLAIFSAGCALGLAVFARMLSWLLARYHDITLAVLAGLMLGSIRKIWPWKETSTTAQPGIDGVIIRENNVLPPAFDEAFLVACLLCLLGLCVVAGVHIFLKRQQPHEYEA